MDDEMINYSAPGRSLPCRADRQKIMERANLVLAEARLVAEQSDRILALLAPERAVGRARRHSARGKQPTVNSA